MRNPVARKLIAKELYLNRGLMGVAFIGGLVSLGISCLGRISFGIGSITFLTTIVAYGVVLPMLSIATERKEKSVIFALSLPISRAEYLRSKIVGVTLSFLIPWAVLLAAALAVIEATVIPDGMILLTVLLMGFLLMNFCIIVCALMTIKSEGAMTLLIIVTNVSVTFFLVGIANLTSVGPASARDVVVWDTTALAILGCEAAVIAAVILISSWINGREPDLV